MNMNRKNIKGYILLASIMLILCGSLISFAAFRNIASEELRINYKIAKTKALYNAHTALAESGHPYLVKTNFVGDTLINGSPILYSGQRSGRLYMGEYSPTQIGYTERGDRLATAEGVAYMQTSKGDTVPVTASAQISTRPESFSKYMYFTNSERAGGAPFTFGGPATGGQTPGVDERRPVTFGSGDILEGIVQCNEDPIVISQYGIPNFSNATLYKTYDENGEPISPQNPDGIVFNGSNLNQLWQYQEVDTTSQPQLVYPPDLEELRDNAHITIDAGRLRESTNGGTLISRDVLIMTDINFSPSAITITEYSYLMPPHLNDAALGNFASLYIPRVENLDGVTTDASGDFCYDLNNDGNLNTFSECGLEESDLCSGENNTFDQSDCRPYIDALYYYHGKGYELDNFINTMPDEWYGNDPEQEEYVSHMVRGPHGINQHFDVLESNIGDLIANARGIRYLEEVSQTQYTPGTYVIYVKDGPVRVKGTYRGQYTIVTDEYTTYERHADTRLGGQAKVDTVWNNIWLTGDLINYDALGQGDGVHQHGNLTNFQQSDDCEDELGSENVMGLVSGANVIVANTNDNSNDIIINAAIMAANESFTVHYWQNDLGNLVTNSIAVSPSGRTVSGRTNSPPWGDARGNPPNTTWSNDGRGEIYLWGSVVQKYRGYTVRNAPSPYRNPAQAGGAHEIGMVKNYHYDQNLKCNPPPFYPSVEPQGAEEVTSVITGFRNLD